MAIGGFRSLRSRLAQDRSSRRAAVRQVLLEALESRQLMAVGPQLIGVQPNSAALLEGGEILQVSPRELVFRFDDAVGLDPDTLSGIRVIRSGADGLFERAAVATDFGTNGQTLVEFYAQQVGEAGNGIKLDFSRVSRNDNRLPRVTVNGRTVNIELNSNPQLQTRVQDLLQVFRQDGSSAASQLVYALRLRGSDTIAIAQTADIGTDLVLAGAGAAKAVTDFGQGKEVCVEFLARDPGNAGVGIRINVTARDRGGADNPIVSVIDKTINVEINSNSRFPTTIQEFVNAINSSNSLSSALVEARLVSGNGVRRIGGQPINYSPIVLGGLSEIEIVPGYVGFGDTDREVVLRFAERLPQSQYRIDILGQGKRALKNANGQVFNDGVSRSIVFGLNLGARIESVVPQPVFRNPTGGLVQNRNQIDLYFNDDSLFDLSNISSINEIPLATVRQQRTPMFLQGAKPTVNGNGIVVDNSDKIRINGSSSDLDLRGTVLDFNFYQLIHTNETLDTRDDQPSFKPTAIRYYPDARRVSLIYDTNLDELRHPVTGALLPAADLRLRVGTNESAPLPPVVVDALANDPEDTFSSAKGLDGQWTLGNGTSQAVLIDSEIKNQTSFELDFPGGSDEPGNRRDRHQDNLRLSADTVDGTSVIYYNFQSNLGIESNRTLLNAISEQQKDRVREVFSLYERYLGVRFVESASLGMIVAVGDMEAVEPFEEIPDSGIPGDVGSNEPGENYYAAGWLKVNRQLATVLDSQDFDGSTQSEFGGPFQRAAMQAVGRLLGLGLADEVEGFTVMAFDAPQVPGVSNEIVLPGEVDIVHGQYLYRPDSKDIDLYQFRLPVAGRITIETFAERMSQASLLDTNIRLYQQNTLGQWDEIAFNDDYFSMDSFIQLDLQQGNYIVGVSASGNNSYDPVISDSGIGGLSQGRYQLRMDFQPPAPKVLRDSTGVAIDGDSNGEAGGVFNFWFRPAGPSNTKFVDKIAPVGGMGSLAAPYRNIHDAITAARSGDVVRVVGNAGADGSMGTLVDNLAYEIGFNNFGQPLPDGSIFDVPKGVSVMIDGGAVLKMRRARVGVGSSAPTGIDRSGGSLLVLGTPMLTNSNGDIIRSLSGEAIPGSVYFTSVNDKDVGKNANSQVVGVTALPGDWGGIDYRNRVDQSDPNRTNNEAQGQFLNWVAHADIRYGGGQVVIDGVSQVVTPIQMLDSRPTIGNSQITLSADAALSASPDSFLESNFHSPAEQAAANGLFSSDYGRVGPAIHDNRLLNNSINGLQVRARTLPVSQLEHMTIPGRFDDTDIVHFIPENLVVAGTAGGAVLANEPPLTTFVSVQARSGGSLAAGTYRYRFANQQPNGSESYLSEPTQSVQLASPSSITLSNIPVGANRVYRSGPNGEGPYRLVTTLASNVTSFVDTGASLLGQDEPTARYTPRANARLAVDSGVIIKSQGSRIETTLGAQVIAEGDIDNPVVFTSIYDRRYGAGGTFDTPKILKPVTPGDWGGVFLGHTSKGSLDHVVLAYGGGTTRIEGGFADFNTIEVHQADLRLTNSRLQYNEGGNAASTDVLRSGRGWNAPATIFVRGAQPIIASNIIHDNQGAVASFDVNSLQHQVVADLGRSRGRLSRFESVGNRGPLVDENRLVGNDINGMVVRGGILTTEGFWDDTDIVHVVQDEIVVSDHNHFSGLRLTSKPGESLVIKSSGPNAGLTARGLPLDNADRIGGSIQVMGLPNFPVVMTSLRDSTVGAGFTPTGKQLTATVTPEPAVGPNLPLGQEVDSGLLIDNDISSIIPGYLAFDVGTAGSANSTLNNVRITAQGNSQLLANANAIFALTHFIDIDASGQAFDLATTTVLTPPTLIANDRVQSTGTFAGPNGLVQWTIQTWIENASAQINSRLNLTSQEPLGQIRVINYLDQNILATNDDLLYVTGTPGQADFRAVTLDGPQRVGFQHGGVYTVSPQALENATFQGWAANTSAALRTAIQGTGTNFSLAGNINTSNLVPVVDTQLGETFGLADAATAFAWDVLPTSSLATVTSFVELVRRNPVNTALAGDWRSLKLDANSNDRNIAVVFENEATNTRLAGTNNSSVLPESLGGLYLGGLADSERNGDENRRLGFQIYGNLASPQDSDTYVFEGIAGTEVWLDVDGTNNSLDAIVELVSSSGTALATSENSLAEENNPSSIVSNNVVVNPLRKSAKELYYSSAQGAPKDLFSTNPRDPGVRLILPGAVGSNNLYQVRVRSESAKTKGSYQLHIRLRETDEVPGSSVHYATIRYATNGIEVRGLPGNSPLLGESAEVESNLSGPSNNTQTSAQLLGNLLATNRQALSVAGTLNSNTDVDWFELEINYQSLTPTALRQYFATVFDLDYSDGIGRPDTSLYVFDSDRNLILGGLGSALVDDLAGQLSGGDASDLTRGSFGVKDPYIGSVELPVGNYFVAVTSGRMMPGVLDGFNNPSSDNPLIRMLPLESLRWIVEDHIGSSDRSTTLPPLQPVLFDTNQSIVPYDLSDVVLYVSRGTGPRGSSELTNVYLVNPFTGQRRNQLGQGIFDVQDIAFRGNREVGFNLQAFDRTFNAGVATGDRDDFLSYVTIDNESGTFSGNDVGIQTSHNRPNLPVPPPIVPADSNDGMNPEAITFGEVGGREVGLMVANRPTPPGINQPYYANTRPLAGVNGAAPVGSSRPGVSLFTNLIYQFDVNTGQAISQPQNDRVFNNDNLVSGTGTQIVERGRIETFTLDLAGNPITRAQQLLAREVTLSDPLNPRDFLISDGQTIILQDSGGFPFHLEFNLGPQVDITYNSSTMSLTDGLRFNLDGTVYEVDLVGGAAVGNIPIQLTTPTPTILQLVAAIRAAAAPQGVTVGFESNRLNFSGAVSGNFNLFENAGLFDDVGTTGSVSSSNIPVNVLLSDDAIAVATKVAAAINTSGIPGASATSSGVRVNLVGASVQSSGPLISFGIAPGGIITGATLMNGRMFAVSDAGGLYRVDNPTAANQGNILNTYVTTSELSGIRFTGLTLSPFFDPNKISTHILFGTDDEGRIHAFDTAGRLQPVFANGRTNVATGLSHLNGLAFSPLNSNLWHTTSRRANDPGHGTPATRTGSSNGVPGGQSLYFGAQVGEPNYRFPGGAAGAVESLPFSLAGVTAAEAPTLYFNYYLETEAAEGPQMRDAFRVYVSGEDGVWSLMATNNDTGNVNELNAGTNVQRLFDNATDDNNNWRQARIPLNQFAGRENLKIRIEFSTAGGFGYGRPGGKGPEIRTISGNRLADGQSLLVSGQRFEIETGTMIVLPPAASIQQGDSVSVNGTRFVFTFGPAVTAPDVPVTINSAMTAEIVALQLRNAINGSLGLLMHLNQNRLQVPSAAATTSLGSTVVVQGNQGVSAGSVAINVNQSMSATQVAQAIQQSLANHFAGGVLSAYPVRGTDTISLTGLRVDDAGPFGLTTSFVGDADQFTSYNVGSPQSQNNDFEGVYVDDFIIGLAGRGEMVVGPSSSTTDFIANPNASVTDIALGPYQLEVRGGVLYGMPGRTDIQLINTFPNNVRMSPGVSLQFKDSAGFKPGMTITVSDLLNKVIFELIDANKPHNVQPGTVPLPFNLARNVNGVIRAENANEMAARFRDTINSALIQQRIRVSANLLNGDRIQASSDTVVLVGNGDIQISDSAIGTRTVSQEQGGSNRQRLQGQVIINSATVSDSFAFGASVSSLRDQDDSSPIPGSPRNTNILNDERLAPGVVIVNSTFVANRDGGISIAGNPSGPNLPAAAVPFARLVNNTIVGGSIEAPSEFVPTIHGGFVFPIGNLAFADQVVRYSPLQSGGPSPVAGLDDPIQAIGVPDYSGTGEPRPEEGVVSLGRGGQLVLQFNNNFLTGSNNANPDLVIFEVGETESVLVEVSADGNTWTNVGNVSAANKTVDLDSFGFNINSRLAFVRLTDFVGQGAQSGNSVGADIDAVGALSSVPAPTVTAGGQGVRVTDNATATLMNNVLVNNSVAVHVDNSSRSTVIGGTVFQLNTVNVTGGASQGQFAIVLDNNVPIFVNSSDRNLLPAVGSLLIDSSMDSILDRPSLVAVKRSLGYGASPIIAPRLDSQGQLRVDDPTVPTPAGIGENAFKDRGSLERGDLAGPSAVLLIPPDNDVAGRDRNADPTVVELSGATLHYFDIRLIDGLEPTDPTTGSGINNATVSSSSVLLYRNDIPLVEGVDYRFGYDSTNGVIRLQPLAGIWRGQSVYTVRFVNTKEATLVAQAGSAYQDGNQIEVLDALGSLTKFEIDLGYQITVPSNNGVDAALADGATFAIDDGTQRIVFEINKTGTVGLGSRAVELSSSASLAEASQAIVNAIKQSGLQVDARQIASGRLQIQGSSAVQFEALTSGLVVSGQSGVQRAFGLQMPLVAGIPTGIFDGQTFTIDRSGSPVVFELDSNNSVQSGNTPVRFAIGASAIQIGTALATAINGAGLGLAASYDGNGVVRLGGDANTKLILGNTVLKQAGVPGQPGAVPISVPADAPASEVADLIRQAIANANLAGVTLTAFGNRLLIEGAQGVSGSGAGQIGAIRDMAGNALKPNQVDGTTVLTIFLGDGFDYGDAPAPYQSLHVDNGPRHKVVTGLSLGATVTSDANARLTGDQDDGVTVGNLFKAFKTGGQILVNNTTGKQAYASLWIDFDGDGYFSDFERVVNAQTVNDGINPIEPFPVPSNAVMGSTYARARISTDAAAVSSPLGAAADGEVEDWAVEVKSNPFTNANWNLDVNASGRVSSIDALQVINWLNDTTKPKDLSLATPTFAPPYVDVSGDGRVTSFDALLVINYLNERPPAGGEGEMSDPVASSSAENVSLSGSLVAQQVVMPNQWVASLFSQPVNQNEADSIQLGTAHDLALTNLNPQQTPVTQWPASASGVDQLWASVGAANTGDPLDAALEDDLLDVLLG